MNCEEIRDLLALHVGGETHENERIAIEAHLPGCMACRCAFDEYRELRAQMSEMKDGTAPNGAIESIWPRVRAEILPGEKKTGRIVAMEWLVRAAAVVVIGIALGYSAMQVTKRAPGAAPGTVANDPSLMPGPNAREAGSGGGRWGNGAGMINQVPLGGGRRGPKAPGNPYLPRVEKILDGDESEF